MGGAYPFKKYQYIIQYNSVIINIYLSVPQLSVKASVLHRPGYVGSFDVLSVFQVGNRS